MIRSTGRTATPHSSPVIDSSASGGTMIAMSVMMRAEVSGLSRTVPTRGALGSMGSRVVTPGRVAATVDGRARFGVVMMEP